MTCYWLIILVTVGKSYFTRYLYSVLVDNLPNFPFKFYLLNTQFLECCISVLLISQTAYFTQWGRFHQHLTTFNKMSVQLIKYQQVGYYSFHSVFLSSRKKDHVFCLYEISGFKMKNFLTSVLEQLIDSHYDIE